MDFYFLQSVQLNFTIDLRKFNTKTLLLSSALIAGLVFTTSNQVKADTTDTGDNTNVL